MGDISVGEWCRRLSFSVKVKGRCTHCSHEQTTEIDFIDIYHGYVECDKCHQDSPNWNPSSRVISIQMNTCKYPNCENDVEECIHCIIPHCGKHIVWGYDETKGIFSGDTP